ncbi:MAG TPA: hypothetical protein VFH89_15190 [Sphingomicrobium sp.]|nr:hypothetical protein [Sphingomicrobium sp.]
MKARLNRQLFEETIFDSGALGLTTSVVHQFAEPGVYAASVRRIGVHVGVFEFEVRGDATEMQLDINLAAVDRGERENDCDCGPQRGLPVVSPKGYVLFHATSGGGWSVHVGEGKKKAFDSERLTAGDMFALTLLEPTKYRMENALGGAKGTIDVSFSPADAKRLSSLQPVIVTLKSGFAPEALKLVATQGLVFRVEAEARIVISRHGRRDPEPARGPFHVQRPRIAEPRAKKAAR